MLQIDRQHACFFKRRYERTSLCVVVGTVRDWCIKNSFDGQFVVLGFISNQND